jgi:hypothetical protein
LAASREPVTNGNGRGSHPITGPPGDDGGRVSQGLADVLMHRLFSAGLDLHAALTYIEADLAKEITVAKIHKAIDGLDRAIRDFRGMVFDLHPDDSSTRAGLRTLIVEAVERACAPGCAFPALTLGPGIETVIGQSAWQKVARLVHRTLSLVPGERLPDVHVLVTADPRPPTWLVIHLDAPRNDLAEVSGRLHALHGRDVLCQDLPRSPERCRIRLEWPMAVR